jgi:hypothetical protein
MFEKKLFDGDAMIRVLAVQRSGRDLDWNDVAMELHGQSGELNAELGRNCMCSGALVRTVRRGTISCQYAIIILRWIGRAPEDFLRRKAVDVGETRLPTVGPDYRLRWDLPALHTELNDYRQDAGLTWTALGRELECTPNRLTNLRTARETDMDLAMRVTQHIARPAAAFIKPTKW